MIYNYPLSRTVYHGTDNIKGLFGLLGELGVSKALIVTSLSVSNTDFYRRFISNLPIAYSEFKEISRHSPMEEIEHAVEIFRNNQCDIIISVGGNSVIDAAKAVRYYYDTSTVHIAIPTHPSGSAFTPVAGYTIGGEKFWIKAKELTPEYLFLDPEATRETPAEVWRSSSVNILQHSIETFYQQENGELSRVLSSLSVKKMIANISGNSLESRYECLLSSWYSYREAYDLPDGLGQNIVKVIGAKWDIPMGIASCITLPQVLKLYAREKPEPLIRLGTDLGLNMYNGDNPASGMVTLVQNLIQQLGLDARLTDFGIDETDLDYIVERLNGEPVKLRKLLTGMF